MQIEGGHHVFAGKTETDRIFYENICSVRRK